MGNGESRELPTVPAICHLALATRVWRACLQVSISPHRSCSPLVLLDCPEAGKRSISAKSSHVGGHASLGVRLAIRQCYQIDLMRKRIWISSSTRFFKCALFTSFTALIRWRGLLRLTTTSTWTQNQFACASKENPKLETWQEGSSETS